MLELLTYAMQPAQTSHESTAGINLLIMNDLQKGNLDKWLTINDLGRGTPYSYPPAG
jgi:hypothetical protein